MITDSKLVIEELDGPSRDEQDQSDSVRVYSLSIGGVPFGQLYATAHNYTLVWLGVSGEFRFANDDAANFIDTQLESVRHGNTRIPYKTRVTLVVANRLERFNLKAFETIGDSKQLMNATRSASFARYDFDCGLESGETVRYAFTIENGEDESKDACEMAFLLPRTQKLANGLFQWIACKHVHAKKLMPVVRDRGRRRHIHESLMRVALNPQLSD